MSRTLRIEELDERTLPATFVVTTPLDLVPGSLRLAILSANLNPGADTIDFNLGAGSTTIRPAAPLPAITDPVTIDGTSQPGYAGTPIVELDGSLAGLSTDGLTISGGGSLVKGLAINRFTGSGIVLTGAGGNQVEGCFIGTDLSGTAARANGAASTWDAGVLISGSANNVIGGTTPAARNLISGNTTDAVDIEGSGATGNIVQGNYLGTDITGRAALANGGNGIWMGLGASGNLIGGTTPGAGNLVAGNLDDGVEVEGNTCSGNVIQGNTIGTDVTGTVPLGNDSGVLFQDSPNNKVGGTAPGAGNLISGNKNSGVVIFGTHATGNVVQGNFIGTDWTGTASVGNAPYGVFLTNNSDGAGDIGYPGNTTIGGTVLGAGNTIAHNAGAGVFIKGGRGDAIEGNSIFGNAGLGIDLGGSGVQPNDGELKGGQSNQGMDYPVFTSAVLSGNTLTLAGYVGKRPGQTLFAGARVEVFKADNDSSGHGEGPVYLGFLTTDASGNLAGSLTVSGISAGDLITGTATDASNDTSEFAADFAVANATSGNVDAATQNTSVYGQLVTFTALVSGTPVATGLMSFYDGTTLLASVPLSGGKATFTTSMLAAGTHSLTAHYGGDSFHAPSTSAPLIHTVTRAPLTVTAGDASRRYGEADPSFSATYSGFVNGDDPTALGGSLHYNTAATASSPAGSYPITPSGLSASNYQITYVSGLLTIEAPSLSATGATLGGTEGASLSSLVATFTTDDPFEQSGDFTATIDWGDGATTAGTIDFDASSGVFTVSGSHTYVVAGSYGVSVSIVDRAGSSASVGEVASIADAPLTASGASLNGVEGSPLSAKVASFVDANPFAVAGDFTATIDWGDGTTTAGTIGFDASIGAFTVSGDHIYTVAGNYALNVSIVDRTGSSASTGGTASVADAPVTASGVSINAVEGTGFSGTVARFVDANPFAVAGDFTATIDWGDGTTTAGVVIRDPVSGAFMVQGMNTYAASGLYAVRVSIQDVAGASVVANSLALVSGQEASSTLTAAGVSIGATEEVAFTGSVGTFVDTDTSLQPGDYRVAINWGDRGVSMGTVVLDGAGQYHVEGNHTYAASGSYSVSVLIIKRDGETATAESSAVVSASAPTPGGGGGDDDGGPPVVVGPRPQPPPGPVVSPPATPTPTPPSLVTPGPAAPPTLVAGPFIPSPTAIVPPTPVSGFLGGPAPLVLPPAREIASLMGQGAAPTVGSTLGSGHGAPTPAVVPARAGVEGAKAVASATPAPGGLRPLQGGEEAVSAMLSNLVQAWLAAVDVAGDEAGAVAAFLGTVPTAGANPVPLDGRGVRDFPRELLWRELDSLEREIASAGLGQKFQQVFGATVVAYVGYVLLNSRSGFWLLSLLMARPLWKQFDPLQVLLAWEAEQTKAGSPQPGDRDEDEETLQSMVGNNARNVRESKGRKHVANQPGARQSHNESPARRTRPGPSAGPRRRGSRRAKSAL